MFSSAEWMFDPQRHAKDSDLEYQSEISSIKVQAILHSEGLS